VRHQAGIIEDHVDPPVELDRPAAQPLDLLVLVTSV
jgi:hypothetical protein